MFNEISSQTLKLIDSNCTAIKTMDYDLITLALKHSENIIKKRAFDYTHDCYYNEYYIKHEHGERLMCFYDYRYRLNWTMLVAYNIKLAVCSDCPDYTLITLDELKAYKETITKHLNTL